MSRISVTNEYRTETGHRLVDCDGKCAHLHGHSYLWRVTATCDAMTGNGMVVDFKDLKAAMKAVLEPLDHCMILHNTKDPIVRLAEDLCSEGDASNVGEMLGIIQKLLVASNGEAPRVLLIPFNPTAENLAAYAGRAIQDLLDDRVILEAVEVWETATSNAVWRPREGV